MNSVNLVGNLVRDWELNTTSTGKIVAKNSIAIRINKDKSIFVPLKAWNGTATLLSDYSSKGNKIAISGSIDIDTFEDENKCKLNYYTYVLVDKVTFCERKEQK